MLLRKIFSHHSCFKRFFQSSSIKSKKYENPIKRTLRILGDEFKRSVPEKSDRNQTHLSTLFPSHVDILIIGGGAMGSSIAYWLKEMSGYSGLNVVVLEKDPTYSQNSTVLSLGGLRQQFSLPENIEMSLYGAEFLRTLKNRFGPEADVSFTPHGYLVLAGEEGAQQLLDNSVLQKELGAINEILTKDQLKERFPWMNTSNIELGCLGLEKEGWFDPWSLLNLLKQGATNLGARFINGEAVDFMFEKRQDIIVDGVEDGTYSSFNEVIVKLPNGEHKSITFAQCIIAAGAESAKIAEMARIGGGPGMLSVPLPVEKRKRYVYRFNCQDEPPSINSPMVIDPSGCYFRREGLGGSFICGKNPSPEHEPSTDNLDVDYEFFDKEIWPLLAGRVPAFNNIKVRSAWSGFYEYNFYDENGIIGPHPYYHNLYIATGFTGHGIQQSPAVGRAIAELLIDGKYQTIDLTRLGFDRLIIDKPMYEIGIY